MKAKNSLFHFASIPSLEQKQIPNATTTISYKIISKQLVRNFYASFAIFFRYILVKWMHVCALYFFNSIIFPKFLLFRSLSLLHSRLLIQTHVVCITATVYTQENN